MNTEKGFPDFIEHIETELGNKLIVLLKADGWKQRSQYSPLMFDKGLDYDFYILKKK